MAKKKTTTTIPASARSPMDVDLLGQIVKLMSANDLNTVDLRDGAKRVILRRGPAVAPTQYAPAQYAPGQYAAASPPMTGGGGSAPATSKASADASAPDDEAGLVAIKSEMPGTFYASPKPGAKAFVAVGSTVVKDETDICIIEAMKTFNSMKSDVNGTIAKVVAQDGQAVQFGQVLFLVKT